MVKKIKGNLFREVDIEVRGVEMAALAFICAIVFGISFSESGKLLYDYNQKNWKSMLSSKPEMQIVESAIAAGGEAHGNTANNEENISLGGNKDPKVMVEVTQEEVNLAKDKADKEAKAEMIARQQAAAGLARINSAPVLAGPTIKLTDGLRVCPLKHPQPSGRGGKPHIDEDCCADYDEYPNPRCEYSPSQWAALKKP